MQDFEGKVAVITGAASGIGKSLAALCAGHGMRVMAADINDVKLGPAAAAARERGGEVVEQVCDVRDPAAVEALAEATYAHFGGCQLLFNNAGVLVIGEFAKRSLGDWEWVFDVNVMGVVHVLRAFVPRMVEAGVEAHIANTASLDGLQGRAGHSVYSASKFAVVGLSESLRAELAPHGIGVTMLCPASTDTNIVKNSFVQRPDRYGPTTTTEDEIARIGASGPKGERRLTPDHVAGLLLAGIRHNEPVVISHQEYRPLLERRFQNVEDALARAEERSI